MEFHQRLKDINFNPRPPCGGRQYGLARDAEYEGISIHALRVEGDEREASKREKQEISIHALRVEGDFNLSPLRASKTISIHALRVEGDSIGGHNPVKKERFQSTPSVWRATSTRASRTPTVIFQSTPSVWRATSKICSLYVVISISIHALRVEGDNFTMMDNLGVAIFQSTPSVWRATTILSACVGVISFQSTPSVRRATRGLAWISSGNAISIHALRVEGDGAGPAPCKACWNISIHALRVEGDE